MEQNQAPRSVSTHIALFGRRNAGKSSLINYFVMFCSEYPYITHTRTMFFRVTF